MSSDLTFDEQSMFTKKVGKPDEPVYIDPKDGQRVVIGPGSKVPKTLIKAGKRKTIKKKHQKKRSLLKSRKVR
jgi:hypothetical protein